MKLEDTQYKHTTPTSSTLVLNPQKRDTPSHWAHRRSRFSKLRSTLAHSSESPPTDDRRKTHTTLLTPCISLFIPHTRTTSRSVVSMGVRTVKVTSERRKSGSLYVCMDKYWSKLQILRHRHQQLRELETSMYWRSHSIFKNELKFPIDRTGGLTRLWT